MHTLLKLLTATILFSASATCGAATWEPIIDPAGHVFPSVLLATSPDLDETDRDATVLGDGRMLIGVAIACSQAGERGTLTVECPDFLEPSSIDFSMTDPGEEYWVFPVLRLKVDALQTMRQQRPVSIVFKVSVNGETSQKTMPATLRSVNDCPFAARVEGIGSEGMMMVPEMFAAYVNENHPYIEKVLKEALDTGIVRQFDGMQSGNPQQVVTQVFAIWNVMQRKGLKYSNITTTATRTEGITSQHVRLLDESIDNAQANCVDGSVLLASILRKIDIEPFLVLVPGHCYLAFYADRQQEDLIGLETTMMGKLDLRSHTASSQSDAVASNGGIDEESDEEFVAGLIVGLVSDVARAKGVKLDKQQADTAAAVLDLIGTLLDDEEESEEDGTVAEDPSDNAAEFDEATLRSLDTFIAAVQHGTNDLHKHADAFNDPENDRFHLVSIQEARADGIMPIGFSAPTTGEDAGAPATKPSVPSQKPKPGSKKKSRLSSN